MENDGAADHLMLNTSVTAIILDWTPRATTRAKAPEGRRVARLNLTRPGVEPWAVQVLYRVVSTLTFLPQQGEATLHCSSRFSSTFDGVAHRAVTGVANGG